MAIRFQFSAVLTYLSEEEGGMATPVSSGSRIGIKFASKADRFIGIQQFHDTDIVFAGDKVTATITTTIVENDSNPIYNGLDFELFDIDRLIATGVVTKLG